MLTNDDFSMTIPGGGAIPGEQLPPLLGPSLSHATDALRSHTGEGAIASVLLNARKDLKPLIVGKPHQPLLDVVHRALKFDPKSTLMVGDRLETDVLWGIRGGVSTMLVLTGEYLSDSARCSAWS